MSEICYKKPLTKRVPIIRVIGIVKPLLQSFARKFCNTALKMFLYSRFLGVIIVFYFSLYTTEFHTWPTPQGTTLMPMIIAQPVLLGSTVFNT